MFNERTMNEMARMLVIAYFIANMRQRKTTQETCLDMVRFRPRASRIQSKNANWHIMTYKCILPGPLS